MSVSDISEIVIFSLAHETGEIHSHILILQSLILQENIIVVKAYFICYRFAAFFNYGMFQKDQEMFSQEYLAKHLVWLWVIAIKLY